MSATSAPTNEQASGPYGGERENYLNCSRGIMSWLGTLDHKRIGIMYMISVLSAFALAGIFAELVRTEHLTPGRTIMSPEMYNQVFTLHGAIMVFLFIIPGIPATMGNFALPIMLGAKDVAFPRINLMSWYLWVIGAICLVLSIATGGLDTGWTFYTPYSTMTNTSVIWAVTGAFILGFSSIFTGLNFIVTVHKMRAPGMGWFDMPLFVWAIYATGIVQILATPVLGITLLLLIVERAMGIGIFRPDLGGDPVLYQHFFWFYSHPAVYIMILPAFGVISELIAVHSRQKIFGYKFIAFSSVAIAILGFLVWGHHLFVSTQSDLLGMVFSAITFTIAIPSAIKVFNWMATMWKGSISLRAPMLYTLSFMFIFVIGGLTGLHLATMATDIHLHSTYFVVAHFHYVMAGTMFVLFGAMHHWWPKIFGRMYPERLAQWTAGLLFVSYNVIFLPQFIMGAQGMPRRYYDYVPEFQVWHVASTIGAYMMFVGLLVMFAYMLWSVFRGRPAVRNPWGAASLEWHTDSPPHHFNFEEPVPVHGAYDFEVLRWSESQKDWVWRSDEPTPEPEQPATAPEPAPTAEEDGE